MLHAPATLEKNRNLLMVLITIVSESRAGGNVRKGRSGRFVTPSPQFLAPELARGCARCCDKNSYLNSGSGRNKSDLAVLGSESASDPKAEVFRQQTPVATDSRRWTMGIRRAVTTA